MTILIQRVLRVGKATSFDPAGKGAKGGSGQKSRESNPNANFFFLQKIKISSSKSSVVRERVISVSSVSIVFLIESGNIYIYILNQ